MVYLLYFLALISMILLTISLNSIIFGRKNLVKDRLYEVKDLYQTEEVDELLLPFYQRLIKPTYDSFADFIGRLTPKGISNDIKQILAYAGADNITVNRFIAIQLMFSILLVLIYIVFIRFAGAKVNLGIIAIAAGFGFYFPIIVYRSQGKKRQEAIEKALPSVLDLLYVSVEAGLGFDMALKRTVDSFEGPLSDEFKRVLYEINKGRNRQDAMRAMVKRTGVDDLGTFISAIIQSEELGSNIANVLRVQSTSMRQKRRQRAEEAAMKVPIKMLFPLVFFMFPALFIVILGPAIMMIIEMFSGM